MTTHTTNNQSIYFWYKYILFKQKELLFWNIQTYGFIYEIQTNIVFVKKNKIKTYLWKNEGEYKFKDRCAYNKHFLIDSV